MNNARSMLGQRGEELVAKYLEDQGHKVIAKNFRTHQGEVDLISQKTNIIAFVEVKTRNHEYFATSSVITVSKQRKVICAAKSYALQNTLENCVLRFDVAIVHIEKNNYTIEYIENAFTE